MKQLTRAEEEVMQILWEIKTGFVKDILLEFPDPKPAYNTVSTIVRILEQKGFVSHESFGRTHQYFPVVEKDDYSKDSTAQLVQNYFNGSYKNLLSFFVSENKITATELEKIIQEMKKDEHK